MKIANNYSQVKNLKSNTSNSNHRLKSAVDMPDLYGEERGLVWLKRDNEARFLHQNEVNFARQRNKMAANLELFHMHLHRKPNANTKLDLRGAYRLSGWCNRCIMVRDFPNSTDQLGEIALTIYLSDVSSANRAEKAWKRRIHSNGKEFSAVPFRMEKEEYL